MAFKDITKVLYDGRAKLDYKDKAHRYYLRLRIDFNLPEDDPKAWGKIEYPKGTTTLLGDTLEKKGLLTWPMGLALRELFGFYDFTNDQGERKTGFSPGVGTLWLHNDVSPRIISAEAEGNMLEKVLSASKAHTRKKQKGADIGSVVHDAIEHFTRGVEYDIAENYLWNIKEAWPLPEQGEEDQFEAERNRALEEMPADVEMATQAFLQFQKWWLTVNPELHGSEDILLSLKHKVVGTYDADLGIPIAYHPKPEMFKGKDSVRCTADYKTSNATTSKEAAAPEGIYYSYFIQLAIYELMRREMGYPAADDLLCVSARKDGSFSLIYASELGLTIDELILWAEAVILCYRMAEKTKKGLLAHTTQPAIDNAKEAF